MLPVSDAGLAVIPCTEGREVRMVSITSTFSDPSSAGLQPLLKYSWQGVAIAVAAGNPVGPGMKNVTGYISAVNVSALLDIIDPVTGVAGYDNQASWTMIPLLDIWFPHDLSIQISMDINTPDQAGTLIYEIRDRQ